MKGTVYYAVHGGLNLWICGWNIRVSIHMKAIEQYFNSFCRSLLCQGLPTMAFGQRLPTLQIHVLTSCNRHEELHDWYSNKFHPNMLAHKNVTPLSQRIPNHYTAHFLTSFKWNAVTTSMMFNWTLPHDISLQVSDFTGHWGTLPFQSLYLDFV